MHVTNMLEWAGRRHADRVAFTFGSVERTYAELNERATRFANGLIDLGVKKGDRVAILVGNQIEYPEVEWAVAKLGGCRTPLLITSSAEDITEILEFSDATAIVASAECSETLETAVRNLPRSIHSVLIADRVVGDHVAYEDLVTAGSTSPPAVDVTADDLYALRFTGGTTGKPKGVLMSHRTMSTVISNMLLNWPVDGDDVLCHFHPLSHAAGMIMYPWHIRGAKQIIVPAFNFDPRSLLEMIQAERATTMFMVPTVLNILLDADILDEYDTSSLRTIIYGAAPPPLERIRQALAALGPVLIQLYGTSEAPNILTTLLKEEHVYEGDELPKRLRSAGRVGLGVEVKVVRDDGTECDVGEAGEVVSRGDHTMIGYWKNEELTNERVKNGWVYTRDIGAFDEEGYLYILDRKDDMIISGGFNIWPAEVEDAVYSHSDVQEAAAFGVPDDKWGEAVVVAIYLRLGADLSEEEVRQYLRGRLAPHKVPKAIWLCDEPIPKSPVGKPLRRKVREQFEALNRATKRPTDGTTS